MMNVIGFVDDRLSKLLERPRSYASSRGSLEEQFITLLEVRQIATGMDEVDVLDRWIFFLAKKLERGNQPLSERTTSMEEMLPFLREFYLEQKRAASA